LRTLGVSLLHAILIALLFLVFPWSDSTRLWPTAAINNIAVILFLFGLLLALRAVAVPGWRGYAWHAVTLLLYVLSVLTYEVAAVAALVAGWLYIGRAPRRRALRLWTIDVVVVVGALIYEWVATAPTRP